MRRRGYWYLARWPGRWRCFARWHGRAFAVALGSWRLTIVPALLLLLAGCATGARVDQVAFDRGAFALAYADLVTPMRLKCAASPLAPTPACAQLQVLDQQVRQAIIEAPKAAAAQPDPLSALLPLLLKLAPLAAGL